VWARLFRIAFLPVQVLIFGSMAVPVLLGLRLAITPLVLAVAATAVAAQIFWFCYGTLLNDYWDQDIDRHHPFGQTVFTEGYFTEKEKRGLIRFFALLALVCELPLFAYIALAHASKAADVLLYAVYLSAGFTAATAYSLPPVHAKKRLLGPMYTLLLVYVMGFLRFALVFGGWNFVVLNGQYILGICWFLYIDHMITSATLKDIPDACADQKGGARTVPLVLGFRPALDLSVAFLAMTMGTGVLFVLLGWLHWWFLLTYPGVLCYFYLYREMNEWISEVSRDKGYFSKVPLRKKFLVYGYIMNWGVWIPCFMLAFDSRLLF